MACESDDGEGKPFAPGFDPRWRDFPDFIIGITREIWEGRGIRDLDHYYAPDIPVRTPAGLTIGNQTTIDATLSTLAQFPDRTLLGEDVIWSVDEGGHYLSSHRICSQAVHRYDDLFGKATGRELTFWVIADCAARANIIDDEWLIRDHGAIVRQLGWDPGDFARHRIVTEGGAHRAPVPFTPAQDRPGPYSGRGNDDPWGVRYADTVMRLMGGEASAVEADYDRACNGRYAGGQAGQGLRAVESFWLRLRASFPDARFVIDHCIGRGDDPLMPPRAALRWSLQGFHSGQGWFGEPSGAEVYVMGACHAEFGPWGLRREWALIDEVAVWKQIWLHRLKENPDFV